MHPQMSCLRGCRVTLIAFLRFFSTVCFQMPPQMASLSGCIVTLIAFFLLVSTVGIHMFPQIGCIMACIVTLVAFVWFFWTVGFQMCPQSACIKGCKVALVAFIVLFSNVYFSNVSSNCLPERMLSRTDCYVTLFFTVSYQMSSQTDKLRRYEVSLVALFALSPPWIFKWAPQTTCLRGC